MSRIPGIRFVQGRNDYGPMSPCGIAIHNTSNDATAAQEADYATRRTDDTGSHLYADRTTVIQSIDTDRRTGHAGSYNGNHYGLAVEITGVNGWTRAQWIERVNWDMLAGALAWCCERYGISVRRASVTEMKDNPRVRAFYGHDDMRRAWGGTTHTDPGPNFPWDHLFSKVKAAMGGQGGDDVTTVTDISGEATGKIASATWAATFGSTNAGKRLANIETMTQALLDAQSGIDTQAILARIDQRAAEDAARDGQAATTLAEMRQRLEDLQSGGASAEDIVTELAERLGQA